eukprot:TRINITY_DN41011_c0_g1_i2.p1 TRINITY_DN41011_c0_g1~~TRINITY_DN41011_c0_g1_i2.p1  ORF type:complete len:338 (+),score=86.26 TRINITY_DN41011_c0_g1_i2:66-1079(+)
MERTGLPQGYACGLPPRPGPGDVPAREIPAPPHFRPGLRLPPAGTGDRAIRPGRRPSAQVRPARVQAALPPLCHRPHPQFRRVPGLRPHRGGETLPRNLQPPHEGNRRLRRPGQRPDQKRLERGAHQAHPQGPVSQVDEYARFAHLYDAVVGPFLRPIHRAVVHELPRSGRVLDLCCGTGALTAMVAARTGCAVGVDNSPAMIARAGAVRPDVEFIRADATSQPFGENVFDGVTLSFALHEKDSDTGRAMLEEARRVLRPGGLLLVADYRTSRTGLGPAAKHAVALIERVAGKDHFAHYREYMHAGGSRAFLERAGFSPDLAGSFLYGCAGLYVSVT